MPTSDLPPYPKRPAAAPTALAGVRVVELSHFIAGPVCCSMLGDFGADVIKIESPVSGDQLRHYFPLRDGVAAPFVWANRNKRSVALDLSDRDGLEAVKALVAGADVLVENFSAGVLAKFGLDFEAVKAINPRLVYCSISAFGRSGDLARRIGFDSIALAECGFMSINGNPEGEPVLAGSSIVDMTTGMMATSAVLAALAARDRTGEGQYVEVAMFDQAMFLNCQHPINYLMCGLVPERNGNRSELAVPSDVYHTRDGGVLFITCANDKTWLGLMTEVLERPDLATDPRFARNADRVENRDVLEPLLKGLVAEHDQDALAFRLEAAGLPYGVVRTIAGALEGPIVAERGLVSSLPHPTLGTVPHIAPPIRMKGTPVVDPVAAPVLGEHTEEVLTEVLGWSADRIAAACGRS